MLPNRPATQNFLAPGAPTPVFIRLTPKSDRLLDRVRAASDNTTNGGASVSFRLRCPPALSHHWILDECWLEDEEGNRNDIEAQSLSDEPSLQTRYGLPADRPWKVTAILARSKSGAARDLTTLNFDATNQISVTNTSGQVFRCRLDGLDLKVESTGWAGANRWPNLAIRAVDPTGEEIPFSERQWGLMRDGYRSMGWTMPRPGLRLQLVTPKVLRTEFVVMPEGR